MQLFFGFAWRQSPKGLGTFFNKNFLWVPVGNIRDVYSELWQFIGALCISSLQVWSNKKQVNFSSLIEYLCSSEYQCLSDLWASILKWRRIIFKILVVKIGLIWEDEPCKSSSKVAQIWLFLRTVLIIYWVKH